jgi:hypothetical protein
MKKYPDTFNDTDVTIIATLHRYCLHYTLFFTTVSGRKVCTPKLWQKLAYTYAIWH